MNFTEVRTRFMHDLKFDKIAEEIFSGLNSRLLLLASEIERLMKQDSVYLANRILFWNTKFTWSKNKKIAPRIDARVDLLDSCDLESARIPVLSAGFCGDIQITEDQLTNQRDLKQFARVISDTIKNRSCIEPSRPQRK